MRPLLRIRVRALRRWGCGGLLVLAACSSDGARIFVAPGGDDQSSGESIDAALASIQAGIERALPGDAIVVLPGEYREDLHSVRAGEPGAPIRLVGRPTLDGLRPVIRGAGASHVIDVRHGHFWIEDLDVDGLFGSPSEAGGYRSKLVYVSGDADGSGLEGVRLLRLVLRNAGTECVRFKYGVVDSEIADSLIENCGVWDFRFGRGRKNGEGIYIGTAPEQIPEDYPPGRDLSSANRIHHNWLRTNGAECIDVKEASFDNRIEHNECSGQRDPDSGGISIRGPRNLVRANRVHDNVGAGIRLGGDEPDDAVDNRVVGNELYDNGVAAFKLMTLPRNEVCENRVGRHTHVVRGDGASEIDPSAECGSG